MSLLLQGFAAAWPCWAAIGIFAAVALGETFAPDRVPDASPTRKWVGHFLLYAAALIAGNLGGLPDSDPRLLREEYEPFVALAVHAGDVAVLVTGLLAFDLFIYGMHRLEHAVGLLWRLHAVHHADDAVDLSTALRHHPLEFVVNATIGNLLFTVLGMPAWVSACYFALSFVVGLFQHANIWLPLWLETLLDTVIVGPAMHRAHHSADPLQHNANFGIVFSFWDRLCGSYRRLDAEEQKRIVFGVREVSESGRAGVVWAWVLPFLIRGRPRPASLLRQT
jgi:sterol desaturase/sphingolipid hydroxylase (fatty acid hydroxylase superfamily)